MTNAELKYSIFKLVSSINDEKTLKEIYQSLQSSKDDWWDELSEEQKESIMVSLDQVKNGLVVSHDQVNDSIDRLIQNYEK